MSNGNVVLKPPSITGARKIESPVVTRVTMLIYGLSGSGKSYMLRSVKEDQRLLPAIAMICDEGHASIVDLVDATLFQMYSTPQLDDINDILDVLSSQPTFYRTIIIDNITVAHYNALLGSAKERVASRNRGDPAILEQSDYGNARNKLLATVGNLMYHPKFANINIVMTAQAGSTVEDGTGVRTFDIGSPGKIATELPGYFDVVGYLYNEAPSPSQVRQAKAANQPIPQPVRYLQTNQTSTILTARNRGGLLPDTIPNPTIGSIIAAYKRGKQPTKTTTAVAV